MAVDKSKSVTIGALLNIVLLAPALVLAVVAFFASIELVQTLAAWLIIATSDSPTRGTYALVSVRNIWLLGGGALLVGGVVYLLDTGFKHWRTRRFRRLLLSVLAIELAIIAAQWFFFS